MQKDEWIPARAFCQGHHLEISFIQELHEYGLLEINTIEETAYLPAAQLEMAEKMARMYADLGINLEGIDAIAHLLKRVEQMQQEITQLRNRLSIYEERP